MVNLQRYRPTPDATMLADEAGAWVKLDDVAALSTLAPSAEAAQPVADKVAEEARRRYPGPGQFDLYPRDIENWTDGAIIKGLLYAQGELREALKRIAKQRLTDDMTLEQRSDADYEYAYNEIVRQARAALAGRTAG
jgi:hypothetical protein